MLDWPVMLNVRGKLAVVVGAGPTAQRRAGALVECGARVVMIAPDAQCEGADVRQRSYQAGDLTGAFLVVIATDDPAVNDAVHRQAASSGVLVNRADEGDEGDVAVMAHARRGPLTVAVSTGGISAAAAAEIRDELIGKLDEQWAELLAVVEPFRSRIRAIRDTARRQAALRAMTDERARAALSSGGATALRAHCESLVTEALR